MMLLWRSEGNIEKSVLSCQHVGPGIELWFSGFAAGSISPAPQKESCSLSFHNAKYI